MEFTIKILIPILSLLISLGIPFSYVLITDNFRNGVLLTWGISFLWFTFLAIPVSELVWRYNQELTEFLPEGNSIVAAAMTGWLPGLIVAALASFSRRGIKHFWPSVFSEENEIEELR